MNEAVNAKEIADMTCNSKEAIRKRSIKENWPFIKEGCRGGQIKTYPIATLPADFRLLIMQKKNNTPTLLYKADRERIPVGCPELSDRQNKIALARADLVRLYLIGKKKAKAARKSRGQAAGDFIAGYNTGALFPNLFSILGPTSVKSVERWALSFKQSNYDYTVIANNYGNRRGQSKATQDELNTTLSFCLHPNRIRIAEAVRLSKLTLKRRQVESPSSEPTLRRAIEEWKKTHYDRWVFCREGEKALNDKCLPYLERDAGRLAVGDVLIADGHMLNFQILHPFTGKPARMAMVAWFDWASRHPAGIQIMPTENTQCVASSLRRAILALGKIPKVVYLDNGKAFKSDVFTSVDFEDAGFYGMFARLGIDTVFAWPYHAQSKPIERFFGTFSEMERLMEPSFTGTSIADKPARMNRNEVLHQKIHEQKFGGWIPTIDQAYQCVRAWVAEYDARPHRGINGLCPGEIWQTGIGPGVEPGMLTFLMMSMEIKTIHRNGVTFMGRNYYNDELYGMRDRVLIRYDLEDLSKIYIFDHTGARFICAAEPVAGVHPMARLLGVPEDMALVKAGVEQKRRLKKETVSDARAFIENAPALIPLSFDPMPAIAAAAVPRKASMLTQGEAEHIEAEAAKMKVLELKPKAPEPLHMKESDRYEYLLEKECKTPDDLSIDDMQFMRYFEKTKLYQDLESRFEFLRELFIAGPETVEMTH